MPEYNSRMWWHLNDIHLGGPSFEHIVVKLNRAAQLPYNLYTLHRPLLPSQTIELLGDSEFSASAFI